MNKEYKTKRFRRISAVLAVATLGLVSIGSFPSSVYADDDWQDGSDLDRNKCDIYIDDNAKGDNGSDTAFAEGGSGDWLTEGTPANKRAQTAFDYFTKELGLSGTSASAFVGTMAHETGGTFEEATAESVCPSAGRILFDEEKFPKYFVFYQTSSGHNVPSYKLGEGCSNWKSHDGQAGWMWGGGGIMQITPANAFIQSDFWKKNGEAWDIRDQIDYELENNVWGNPAMGNQFLALYGTGVPNVQELLRYEGDVVTASKGWYAAVLRGVDKDNPLRFDDARKAEAFFNKDHIKADESKWRFHAGSIAGAIGAAVQNASQNQKAKDAGCNCYGTKNNGGLGSALGSDGSGELSSETLAKVGAGRWVGMLADEVPDDVKQYAIDWESVGMKWGDCGASKAKYDGVANIGVGYAGQCVAHSKEVFWRAWIDKDSSQTWDSSGLIKHLGSVSGNGNVLAGNMHSALGGDYSKTPHAGDVFSSASTTGNPAGHTGVVNHVFSNGDIYISEQNNPKAGRGAGVGRACEWSYRYVVKAELDRLDYKFWHPDESKYMLNPELRTLDGKTPSSGGKKGFSCAGGKDKLAKVGQIQQDVFNYAEKHLGTPYVWGGESETSGWDCSGYVMKAYHFAGIDTFPHGTDNFWDDAKQQNLDEYKATTKDGKKWVAKKTDNPVKGDFIIYKNCHAAIFEAEGQILHASSPKVGTIRGKDQHKCGAGTYYHVEFE